MDHDYFEANVHPMELEEEAFNGEAEVEDDQTVRTAELGR